MGSSQPGYLSILEVSQKQAYIFSSNSLKDNVSNSSAIAWVTESSFFKEINAPYSEEKNLVYSGGGHTMLQFEDEESARSFNMVVTKAVMERFPEMEIFARIMRYDAEKSPRENVKELIRELEIKKSERKASFKKGSYGIEKLDPQTRKPEKKEAVRISVGSEKDYIPEGYKPAFKLEDLGGSKDKSNFVAVVHIDGNGMGNRVGDFQRSKGDKGSSWEDFRKEIKCFSDSVDSDFKEAYREMADDIAKRINDGTLNKLSLKDGYFPVRRIITSGDDICYIAEGRIGIESARIFIEKLKNKRNKADGKGYDACAGVAVVHVKYPFFRAYELAEALCSNAKSFGAKLSTEDNGASVSAIDWHIEFGEMGDDLAMIRDQYRSEEGKRLEMRPYILSASDKVLETERYRQYSKFQKVLKLINGSREGYARSGIKELRSVLRRREADAWHYLVYHKIDSLAMESYQDIYTKMDLGNIGTGKGLEKKLFVETADGKERSTLFDAIEIMDSVIMLDGEG